MGIENEDKSLSVGQNPIYAFYEGENTWRKVRCDSTGAIYTAAAQTESDVAEPTTTAREIHSGPAQVLSVTNTTAQLVSILDGVTVVALVLPSVTLSAPITINTSLSIVSAGTALSKKVATIWRPL